MIIERRSGVSAERPQIIKMRALCRDCRYESWPTSTKKLISPSRSLSFTTRKILLIHHRKLDKWLPLGGHIELDEDPEQAALREAKEESGLDVELLGERPPTTSPGTRALIAPRFLDIHRISDTHEHIGMIYWARPQSVAGGARRPHASNSRRRGASRHSLVHRRRIGQTRSADDRRGKMVLPQGHRGNFRPVTCASKIPRRLLHHRGHQFLRGGDLFQLPLFFLSRPVWLQRQPKPRCSPR